jgi:phosphatidylglycerol:prolipoprotein diacylglycerol transferase
MGRGAPIVGVHDVDGDNWPGGIRLDIALEIGPLKVAWYGIFISLAVIAAVAVASLEAKRRGHSTDHLLNMLLLVLPLGIIGARVYHVIDQWGFYSQNPGLIIGGRGLGIFGAVIGGAVGLIVYTKWKRLSTLTWLDICAPGLIIAQAIGRWGNFFNQELYGYPTDLPWGVYIDPAHRIAGFEMYEHFHPLFLYESALNLVGFALLLITARKFGKRLLPGELFVGYVVYYGVVRFVLEGFKIDVWQLGGVPTARWLTLIAIIVAITLTVIRRRRHSATPEQEHTTSSPPEQGA